MMPIEYRKFDFFEGNEREKKQKLTESVTDRAPEGALWNKIKNQSVYQFVELEMSPA